VCALGLEYPDLGRHLNLQTIRPIEFRHPIEPLSQRILPGRTGGGKCAMSGEKTGPEFAQQGLGGRELAIEMAIKVLRLTLARLQISSTVIAA
jgi:hypothetical protein